VSNKETIEEKTSVLKELFMERVECKFVKISKIYFNAIIYIGKALAVIDFETINIIKLNNVNVDISVNLIIN
jgi:hypothetical protein